MCVPFNQSTNILSCVPFDELSDGKRYDKNKCKTHIDCATRESQARQALVFPAPSMAFVVYSHPPPSRVRSVSRPLTLLPFGESRSPRMLSQLVGEAPSLRFEASRNTLGRSCGVSLMMHFLSTDKGRLLHYFVCGSKPVGH